MAILLRQGFVVDPYEQILLTSIRNLGAHLVVEYRVEVFVQVAGPSLALLCLLCVSRKYRDLSTVGSHDRLLLEHMSEGSRLHPRSCTVWYA